MADNTAEPPVGQQINNLSRSPRGNIIGIHCKGGDLVIEGHQGSSIIQASWVTWHETELNATGAANYMTGRPIKGVRHEKGETTLVFNDTEELRIEGTPDVADGIRNVYIFRTLVSTPIFK